MKVAPAAVGIVAALMVVLAACGGVATSSVQSTTPPTAAPVEVEWLEITLEADSAGETVSTVAMDQAAQIVSDRLDAAGVCDARVERRGDRQIVVQLPGVEDLEQALALIGRTAMLEFYDVAQFDGPYATADLAIDAAGVDSEEALPQDYTVVFWPATENGVADEYYLVTMPAEVTGAMLKSAAAGFDQYDKPKVDIAFTDAGADAFAEVTARMAAAGEITGQLRRLAIVLDGTVMSAPTVREEITGGYAEITGNFTMNEATNLATVFQAGALPVDLVVASQEPIPAP
jgi:preprotein translocase subunit SecD